MPSTVTGTRRQALQASDGTQLQRMYVYLPVEVWHLLQHQARTTHTSVSQLIESFALGGNSTSKDINAAQSRSRHV